MLLNKVVINLYELGLQILNFRLVKFYNISLTSIQWEQPRKGRFTTIIILNYNQGDKSVPPQKKKEDKLENQVWFMNQITNQTRIKKVNKITIWTFHTPLKACLKMFIIPTLITRD